MQKDLTDRFLKSVTPPEYGRIEISDTRRPGLRFRLSASGHASWMYEKRVRGGPKRKHTFGTWPEPISLSDARALALEIEAEAAKGIDRVLFSQAARIGAESSKSKTLSVRAVIDVYDRLHLSSLRTGAERKRQIEQSLAEKLGAPIASVTRRDLQAAIDAKAQAGRKVFANRIRAALVAFTKWLWGRGYIEHDFGAALPKTTKETSRERTPTVAEIRQIWEASFQMGDLWGPMLRLLILTAQRRGEILGLRWKEVDLERMQITKSGAQTKNTKAHITHLSAPAIAEIEAIKARLDKIDPNGESFLFTTTGNTPVSGVSKAKVRLDKILGDDFEPWRLHDIRTGFATAMVEFGVPENIADRVLNHSASGSAPSAVARVYNQAEQLPQRARALDKWAEMVTCDTAKVYRITN